jgi:hypothetical protein
MMKKKLENARANSILNFLTLQKELQEVKVLYEESRKQWDIETERMKTSIQVDFSLARLLYPIPTKPQKDRDTEFCTRNSEF